MTASLIGDGIFLVAIAWTAYSLWNTPVALSIVGIAMTVPTIACLLLGGVISDRFDRRLVLLCSDLGRGLVVGLLALLATTHTLDFAMLTVIVAAYGVGAAFFTPAFESIVPTIVDPGELAQANALDQFVRPIALRLIGPALGGWLIGSSASVLRLRSTLRRSSSPRSRSWGCAASQPPRRRLRRRLLRSATGGGSSEATSGSGGRCCRQLLRISPSSDRPRRSCRTWSRTSCTGLRAISDWCSPPGESERSPPPSWSGSADSRDATSRGCTCAGQSRRWRSWATGSHRRFRS